MSIRRASASWLVALSAPLLTAIGRPRAPAVERRQVRA